MFKCYFMVALNCIIIYNARIINKIFTKIMEEKNNSEWENSSLENEDFDLDHFSEEPEENILTSWFKKVGLMIFEIVKVVLISLAIIMPIRLFIVQPFYVDGPSMEPNFYDREYLIIDEVSYRFNEPVRGEVVVFKNPKNPSVYFIKRIIGLPGEKVEIKDGNIFINDEQIEESSYIEYKDSKDHPAVEVGPSEYYLMGDNRVNSFDSRSLGPIDDKYLIGKVWLRGWPINRINTFNTPTY